MAVLSKKFLFIQATIECGFTLKCVRDMTRTYGQYFIVLPCLLVSATVQRFLPGWVGLNKKRRSYVTRGNFGMDATRNTNLQEKFNMVS